MHDARRRNQPRGPVSAIEPGENFFAGMYGGTLHGARLFVALLWIVLADR
jgi:hypothetical protein